MCIVLALASKERKSPALIVSYLSSSSPQSVLQVLITREDWSQETSTDGQSSGPGELQGAKYIYRHLLTFTDIYMCTSTEIY